MKKFLFLSILAGLTFTGCTNDELLGDGAKKAGNNDYISFQYQQKNMTRTAGYSQMQNSHYEFGVFADNGDASKLVMNNYLVAYADDPMYNGLFAGATTYGDPTSQVDGLSYWFYESLGKTAGTYVHTPYNTPDLDQDLKYWDKSKTSYKFWAYAPYTNTTAKGVVGKQNSLQVAFADSKFTFTNLSSFYTNPQTQIATADVEAAGTPGSANYNKEMVNYNEGLYAYTEYGNTEYGTDVPFLFQHINAKVNLKFYNDIKGYNVEIIDVKPSTTDYDGIQLSPATTLMSQIPMTKPQPTNLPAYFAKADVEVSGMGEGTAATIAVGKNATLDSLTTANLKFQLPTGNIGVTKASATASPTTLYVLPNYKGGYITPAALEEDWMTETYDGVLNKWNTTTPSTSVADSTGYTLHVSYTMHPKDGSADITVYDARVFVPASACQWEAGKAYTYIFKFTKNSNGVTNPDEIDPATKDLDPADQEPWVDVTDPRVGNEPGLLPIVFDGIEVKDYEDADATEYIISETTLDWSLENAFKNLKTILSTGNTDGAAIYGTKTGTGVDADNAYVFTLNTVTSDYINYTGDVNNNNVFKDLQAIFQALYNEKGIKEVVYNSKTYVRQGDGVHSPYSFYNGGKSVESDIATAMFGDWIYNDQAAGAQISGAVKLVSSNTANPDTPIFIKVTVANTANETLVGTNVKKVAATLGTHCKGGIVLTGTDGAYTVTLNAVDADLMWPGYPSIDVADTNDNNAFNDIFNFFNGIIGTEAGQVASAVYNTETFGTSNVADLAAAIATYGFAQANPTFATTPKFVKDTYNCGTVTLDGEVTVTLMLDLDVK